MSQRGAASRGSESRRHGGSTVDVDVAVTALQRRQGLERATRAVSRSPAGAEGRRRGLQRVPRGKSKHDHQGNDSTWS
jgi:hypothetical protein